MRQSKHAELKEKFMGESLALYERFLEANKDFVQRGELAGVTLAYDKDCDMLTITVGQEAPEFYTQGIKGLYFNLDLETDKILGITVLEYAAKFVKARDTHKAFKDILPALITYGSISFPPDGSAHRMAEDIRSLVPAYA